MSQPPPALIAGLYRYPVKGLTPEPLQRVRLRPGQTLPADRRYAIENGPSGFDPTAPAWLPKSQFLMLMRNEGLAGLRSHFEDASHMLTICRDGKIGPRGDRGIFRCEFCARAQGSSEAARKPRPQFF